MDTDTRFYCNDQSLWSDLYGNLPVNRRRMFTFNRIKRIVNMVSGYQRRNRKSTIVVPVENADAETADQFTKILYWIHNQENVLETISESFLGSLITGMNLLHVWMDYRQDPISGNIRVDNCSYNSFLMDPFYRKADLSDCNFVWKRTFLTKEEAISLLPDHREEIMGMEGNPYGGSRDGKFQFLPESYSWSWTNLLTYDEYYYRDYRDQVLLVDTQTGESMEWTGKNQENLKLFLRLHPTVTTLEQRIPTVKLAIVCQGRVLYDGGNPMGIDSYPFVPVWAYYTPELPYYPYRIQGMVRGLRDAQYLYNRRRVIELDILESVANSGYIYKENALVNPKDVWTQTGQGRGIAIKQEAQITDVQQIQPPQVPPSMIQLSELLAAEVSQISGVNEELLGSAVDDKAGILSMLRQGAGLTTLQNLFDQLDRSQKILGKLMIDLIQANFMPGKVQKILQGAQPMPQFYNKAFGRYDANVEEGMNTTTQRQMQFAQLIQLREMGVPIPDETLIEAVTIENKKQLIEAIQQNKQQQMQMSQMQMQSEINLQEAQTKLANARATADEGLGIERLSRVRENEALAEERKAEAERERQQAVLNMVKALKELDHMDIAELEKLLVLRGMEKRMEDAAASKTMASQQPANPPPPGPVAGTSVPS